MRVMLSFGHIMELAKTSLTSQLAFARRQPLEPKVVDLDVRLDAMAEICAGQPNG